MASVPTEFTPQVLLVDPRTGLPTKDFLQKLNELIRAAKAHDTTLTDHETRIDALEP